jgi:hypothetical protein
MAASTRAEYRTFIHRFFRWADACGLSLKQIASADVLAYIEELRETAAKNTANQYVAALRSFFRHLADAGVVSDNPCTIRPAAALARTLRPRAGFDLLALMAMLANMEQESRRRVFEEEESALALLDQVRWPDGADCPGCGGNDHAATAGAGRGEPYHCVSCGQKFTVLTGTMFEGSELLLRHWLHLIHQRFLTSETASDTELAALIGVDTSSIPSLCTRLRRSMNREGIPNGDALETALADKDRQLVNDQFARDIIRYAEMTSVREQLIEAKAIGTEVPDLPPGMSLDEAVAILDAQIAEADRWVFYLEDGCICRKLADETLPAGPVEASGGD